MRYEFKQMTSVKYISMSCLLLVRCIFESIFVEILWTRLLGIMSVFSKATFPVISMLFGACWCQILIKPEKVGHIITAGQIDIMSASKQTLWHFHLKKFHWTQKFCFFLRINAIKTLFFYTMSRRTASQKP